MKKGKKKKRAYKYDAGGATNPLDRLAKKNQKKVRKQEGMTKLGKTLANAGAFVAGAAAMFADQRREKRKRGLR